MEPELDQARGHFARLLLSELNPDLGNLEEAGRISRAQSQNASGR
jgi:hypothetical protein